MKPGSGDGEDGFTTPKAVPTGRAQKNVIMLTIHT